MLSSRVESVNETVGEGWWVWTVVAYIFIERLVALFRILCALQIGLTHFRKVAVRTGGACGASQSYLRVLWFVKLQTRGWHVHPIH